MIPKKLIVSNFMILSRVEIDFDQFSSAIIIARINGDTRKSNGSGKSTVFHALNYALFDFLPVSPLEKAIRENQNQMSVILEFEIENSGLYRISRSRRRKSKQGEIKLEKFENQNWKDKSEKTNSETEKEIQILLGFNLEILKNTNFFGQSDLSGLFSARSLAARRSIFEDLFMLQIYSVLEKNLQQRKIKELEKEVLKLERDLLSYKDLEIEISKLDEDLNLEEEKKKELENSVLELEEKIVIFSEKITEQKIILSSQKESNIQNLKQKQLEKTSLQFKIAEVEKIIVEKNKLIRSVESQIEERKKESEKLLLLLEAEKNKKLRSPLLIKPELEKTQKNEVAGRNFVSRLEAEVRQKEKQNLPENQNCPECEQNISDEYRVKHCEDKKIKLKEQKLSLEGFRVRLAAITAKKINLETEWETAIIWENQLAILEEKLNGKEKEILNLLETEKQQKQFLSHFEGELNNNLKNLATLEVALNNLVDQSSNLNLEKDKETLLSLEKKLQEEKQNKQKILILFSENDKKLAVTKNSLQIKKNDLEQKKKITLELSSKKEELEISYLVQSSFKDAIPRFIISENVADLEQQVNLWLEKLKPDVKIKINSENFEIEFLLENKSRVYDQLSFGQKFIIFVAFKLGMQNLLKKKFNFSCSLLQFDEVDQSFDENNVEVYLNLIKELQKNYKVLVVAHNDNLKSFFSHSLVLESNGIDSSAGELISH